MQKIAADSQINPAHAHRRQPKKRYQVAPNGATCRLRTSYCYKQTAPNGACSQSP